MPTILVWRRTVGRVPPSVLIIPTGGAGDGMGHVARSLRLARRLGPRTAILETYLDASARRFLEEAVGRRKSPIVLSSVPRKSHWDAVLIDKRRTTRADLESFESLGPVFCMDEGGEARLHASFLIDTLPNLVDEKLPANVSSPGFLDLPARSRRKRKAGIRRVLVSFGGEDRAGLSGRFLSAALKHGVFTPRQLTVVEGPLFGARAWPEGVSVMRGVSRLTTLMPEFDLVITHFGLTAFEALATGVPVITLNPSRYHEALSRKAGLLRLGIGRPDIGRLRGLLSDPVMLQEEVDIFNGKLGAQRSGRLASLLSSMDCTAPVHCPVCGAQGNAVIGRFPQRTYRRCRRCGTIYMQSFAMKRREYGRSYFSSEYKAQYGRTYLEDFESIRHACHPRVKTICRLLETGPRGAIVDVGCAYGPFLAALADEGFEGFGLDVAADAVDHVRKILRIPAVRRSFENVPRGMLPRHIAGIAMWYVIEHFNDVDNVLKKAADLLPEGGVLAFSTPNGRGISARKDLHAFLSRSPSDHCTIFSPRGLRRLLSEYGFLLQKVRVTGHHPERFPGLLGRAAGVWAPAGRLLGLASRLLGLGDTFEAYAVKEGQS